MAVTDRDSRFWDRVARKYAARTIADLAGYERTLEATRRYLRPEHVVFEFGCGTGTTALRLAPSAARFMATDLSGEMIVLAREKAQAEACRNVEFAVASLEAAQWPDESFDVALGFNVLHLIKDRPAAIAGVRRLLKPGGVFISKTPCIGEMNPLIRLAIPPFLSPARCDSGSHRHCTGSGGSPPSPLDFGFGSGSAEPAIEGGRQKVIPPNDPAIAAS